MSCGQSQIRQKDSSSIKTINQVQQAVEIGRIKSFLDSIQTKISINRIRQPAETGQIESV